MALRASRCFALCIMPPAHYCVPDDSFVVLLHPVTRVQIPPEHYSTTGHSTKTMTTDLGFGVIVHQPQRPIIGVLTHWPVRVMVAGEHQLMMPGNLLYFFQNGDGAVGKRHQVRGLHFCPPAGEPYFCDGFAGGGNGPDFISEINLTPAGKTQFAGADKQMQRGQYRQAG